MNFSVMTPLLAPILRELQQRYGVTQVSGFAYGRDVVAEIASYGIATTHVRALSSFLQQFDPTAPADLEFLRAKEHQYGTPHLYPLIAGCRFVGQFDHQRARRVLEAGFRLIESLFDETKPDAVLSDGVACTMSYIQYLVAQRRGIPFLTLSSSRISNRFYVTRSHLEHVERVEQLFAEYKVSGVPATSRRRAEDFLRTFLRDRQKPAYFLQFAKPPAMDFRSVRELARLVRLYYVIDRGNYILMSPFAAIAGRITRVLKTFLFDKRHFLQPVAGEKFVFFPLHYQPEQTTLIWAPYHIDQIATIENVAKTLPIDHRLYVKEHKGSLGRRPAGFYERLSRIPNVRLLDPYVDSHDMIQAASAICVLTSTVAWEAILYEKPVVSLGDAFFNVFDLVTCVKAMDDLPAAFHHAMTQFRPDRELLLQFIAANLDGTYEGNADYMPGVSRRDIEPDRVRRMSDVVAGELGLGPLQPAHLTEPVI